jgi:diguanylate cyclase (GGDEF)-like protein
VLEGVLEALASLPPDRRSAALEGLDLSAFGAASSDGVAGLVETLAAKNAQLHARIHELELDLGETRARALGDPLSPGDRVLAERDRIELQTLRAEAERLRADLEKAQETLKKARRGGTTPPRTASAPFTHPEGQAPPVETDPARIAQALFVKLQGKGRSNPLRPAVFVIPASGPGLVSTASEPEFRAVGDVELAANRWWMDRCQPGVPVKIHDAGGAKVPQLDSREPAGSVYAFELPFPEGKGFLLVTGKRARALDEASIHNLAATLGWFGQILYLALKAAPAASPAAASAGAAPRTDQSPARAGGDSAPLTAWRAAGKVLRARDLAGIGEAICVQGCEVARAKGAALYVLSPYNEQLSLTRLHGLKAVNVKQAAVLGKGLLGEAVDRRATLHLGGAGKAVLSEVEGVTDAIVVPLLGPDTTAGGLVLADPAGGGSIFEPIDVQRAGELAEPLGLVLAHALSAQGLREKLEIDEMTGLHNRHFLDSRIAELVASVKAHQYRESFAMVLIKLNRLLDYAADEDAYRTTGVLTMLATLLQERVPRGGLLARHGASTFAIVLPGARKTNAADVAMSILNAISALPVSPASGAQATAAAAVGVYPLDSIDQNAFLELMDQALARAAGAGVSTLKYARD